MIKKLSIILSLLLVIYAGKSQSLNIFEISLIGIGVGFVADQYFDSSMNEDNNIENRAEILNKYYDNNRFKISSKDFFSLPLQEKLLVLDHLENF